MKKKWEVRYFVTAVASVPVYKAYSKTETYRQATKDGWGTVYRDENNVLVCDEDCAADLYTKNGGYFGIRSCDEIITKEMPKQAECAAIIVSDSCGFTFWAEDFSQIHIFVTYDENGLIDTYRVEYGDTPVYDGEVEISFDDLYERAEEDYRETYRAELPGTVEYQHKQEADKLAQEAGETWMNEEERKQFRQVCGKIDRIKSAWDFLCTMSLLECDYDKKIINAARKLKKCFSFAQYEKPQETDRREELMEDYRKFEFVTADTDTAEPGAEQTTEPVGAEAASAAGADTTATENGQRDPQGEQATEQKAGGGAGPPPPGKRETGVKAWRDTTNT